MRATQKTVVRRWRRRTEATQKQSWGHVQRWAELSASGLQIEDADGLLITLLSTTASFSASMEG